MSQCPKCGLVVTVDVGVNGCPARSELCPFYGHEISVPLAVTDLPDELRAYAQNLRQKASDPVTRATALESEACAERIERALGQEEEPQPIPCRRCLGNGALLMPNRRWQTCNWCEGAGTDQGGY